MKADGNAHDRRRIMTATVALFGPKTEVKLKIGGMHCANCKTKVGEALRRVPGVKAANVDLLFHRAVVSADTTVDRAALVAAVEGAGYAATLVEGA